ERRIRHVDPTGSEPAAKRSASFWTAELAALAYPSGTPLQRERGWGRVPSSGMAERLRLVVHGHFYQPPRENPWTEEVTREASAAPFHDWNERITAESYRPNAYARIVDDRGRLVAIVDNYEHISFDMGPTLLSWLERHHPNTYRRMVAADRIAN